MHERLTAQDAAFLGIEDHNTPMQVGATMIFDSTSVVSEDGCLDMDSVRNLVASRLGLLPRYRQRVLRLPVAGDAFWVDDEHFDIRHHIRHVTIPRPADTATFQDLTGAFFAAKLDKARPLWDVLIVDGLEGGRAAALAKAHHCLIDGVSGVDLLLLLLSPNPVDVVPEPPRWNPEPAPSAAALVRTGLRHRIDLSRSLLDRARLALRNPGEAYEEARDRTEGLVEGVRSLVSSASETSQAIPTPSPRIWSLSAPPWLEAKNAARRFRG